MLPEHFLSKLGFLLPLVHPLDFCAGHFISQEYVGSLEVGDVVVRGGVKAVGLPKTHFMMSISVQENCVVFTLKICLG